MGKLIAADEIVRRAKSKGIDFGKGSPYNRLRYYTKIGWLPHMIRKKNDIGIVEGHYPTSALARLELIQGLKEKGYSNSEIASELENVAIKTNLKSIFDLGKERKIQLIAYLSFFLLVLILLSELGFLSPNNTKQRLSELSSSINQAPNQILASGDALIPANSNIVFVKTNQITANSKVYLTFNDDYSPAIRYWVSNKVSFEGFYVQLDSPTAQNSNFSWWISN